MRALFFAFLLVVFVVQAGKTTLASTIQPGNVITQRTGIFSAKDNPLAAYMLGRPYVSWDLQILVDKRVKTTPVLEAVIFHHDLKRDIGIAEATSTEYCCTSKSYSLGLCDQPGQLLFKNRTFLTHKTKNMFYYYSLPSSSFSDGLHRFTYNISLEKTGMWYYYIANCDESNTQSLVAVSGVIEWMNPYGYLPGQIATKLPVYWTLSICFLFLLILYSVLCCCYSENLMGLQYAILAVIVICLVEQLLWSGALVFYNINGLSSPMTNGFGAFFTATKMTAIRCLLLLVGLGLSITKPQLSPSTIAGICLITVVYFTLELMYEYTEVSIAAGDPVSRVYRALVLLGSLLANLVYLTWIVVATYVTTTVLEEQGQTEKASQYTKLGILLVITLALSGVVLLLQGAIETMRYSDEYFKWWWSWDAYWQFVYFACVFAVAMIWKPSSNNVAYAYSSQIPSTDFGESKDELQETEGDGDVPLDMMSSGTDVSESENLSEKENK